MQSWSILQILSAKMNRNRPRTTNTPKPAAVGLSAELVTLVCDACRMPMLKTNIAALEIDECLFPFENLLPIGEAIKKTALWGRLLNAVVR